MMSEQDKNYSEMYGEFCRTHDRSSFNVRFRLRLKLGPLVNFGTNLIKGTGY